MNQESIMMKRIYDEAQKEKYINLYYNKTLVEVSKRILQKERLLLPAKKERFWKFYTAKSLDTFYPM
jgi:2-keto-4-pentenoate hydratase/2-oxohepta-3-ene-1,7-dioic acid hydratase in catechol pathway